MFETYRIMIGGIELKEGFHVTSTICFCTSGEMGMPDGVHR